MRDNTQKRREDTFDTKIRTALGEEFPLPESVNEAKEEAFDHIRAMEREKKSTGADKKVVIRRKNKKYFWKTCAGLTAVAAAFSAVCITNPAFAANIPLVGHVFEQIGESLGFSGNYEKYAKAVEAPEDAQVTETTEDTDDTETGYRQSSNGLDITLSETYCSDSALYMSLILESEEVFPDTMIGQDGKPIINLYTGTLKTDFSPQELPAFGSLDGKFIDDHTFAGVFRYDLAECAYQEDGTIVMPEIPDSFQAVLKISQIVGDKAVSTRPEMPEDIRAAYETAMKENGLGLTDEDYEGFTEEQKDIEYQLFSEMINAYTERYPETSQMPNKYENWWVDGNWEFTFEVSHDERDTVTVEIGDVDENGLGLVSVTKTPFEITIKDGQNPDMFTVALDAQGDILPYGGDGNTNTYAVQDRDVSTIDVYICDYVEYMDELKGYYWAEDYEEKKKTKTFKELLDERALYHKEISLEKDN